MAEKPHWDTSYKIPKHSLPDTSVSSGGPTPRKTDKFKRPAKKADKKGSASKQGKKARMKTGKGSASVRPPTSSDLPIDYWANNRPGDDTIPAHAERIEWPGGQVLFQVTRHHPLLTFETERQARRQMGQRLRLW